MDGNVEFFSSSLHTRQTNNFLFLQGVASSFFSDLGQALLDRGHRVRCINFNGGDKLFWRLDAVDYGLDLKRWPEFLERRLREWSISDIVLFGDCRPLHAAAIKVGRRLGLRLHIFEEGYLRPNWLTIESEGVNGHSSLPRQIEAFLATAGPDESPIPVASDMKKRSFEDVCYTAAMMAMRWRFPFYQHYRPFHPLVEYMSGARRIAYRKWSARRQATEIARLVGGKIRYFLWPLQIEVDSQISVHSQFKTVKEAIELVLTSFAGFAPPELELVVTEHPLETSPFNWRRYMLEAAARAGLGARVSYLVNGTPDKIIEHSQGVVVINSTIGQRGLVLGRPVIALSGAVFNMPGLTFQHGLDRFWREAQPADRDIVRNYRRGLIARCQINGGLYSAPGIALAVKNAVARMEACRQGAPPALNFATPRPSSKPVGQAIEAAVEL
jgi:capsular polysaccharide export protein